MTFHDLAVEGVLKKLNTDKNLGLNDVGVKKSCEK